LLVRVCVVTAISTGAGPFQPWLNGTRVAKARLNETSSVLRSNTTKRHGCELYDEGAQRAASRTACRWSRLTGSLEYARGLQRPAISS
jgi:hypothetical protein